jgi:polyferredoxin
MLTGISFAWLDYELFTAFMFQQASWVVITVALLFVALSLFVQRPFCRFVCPMGTLFKLTQNAK